MHAWLTRTWQLPGQPVPGAWEPGIIDPPGSGEPRPDIGPLGIADLRLASSIRLATVNHFPTRTLGMADAPLASSTRLAAENRTRIGPLGMAEPDLASSTRLATANRCPTSDHWAWPDTWHAPGMIRSARHRLIHYPWVSHCPSASIRYPSACHRAEPLPIGLSHCPSASIRSAIGEPLPIGIEPLPIG